MTPVSGNELQRSAHQLRAELASRRELVRALRRELGEEHEPPRPRHGHESSAVASLVASGLFDPEFYLRTNPDVAAAGVDPLAHYLETGHREGRDPSASFSTAFYRATYLEGDLDRDPLLDYVCRGRAAGLRPTPAAPGAAEPPTTQPARSADIAAEVRHWTAPGDDFEELDPQIAAGVAPRVKAMAFYLPQFHPIPENDEWWGTGFTEWRNVARGTPRFTGHYQPRVPRDLGHYDLRDIEVMRRQAGLARAAGLHGFCFYYYWFNGRRLLERPVEQFLADPSIDQPFCLMWANENWTRRWDGFDEDVLIRQDYDRADEPALVDDFQRHFADPRYLRIGGRPLLCIYRLDIVPRARAAIKRWRRLWRERHDENPLIFIAECFGNQEPDAYGVDGAIEFPPHRIAAGWPSIRSELDALDPQFSAHVLDYGELARASLERPHPTHPLIKTAIPGWDNDARRQGAGGVIQGSTPRRYEDWLRGITRHAQANPAHGESIVFINAWNEWAEGAYLEPDIHYGSAYLNATARAVCGSDQPRGRRKILLVGHDAHPHGSQMNLRHIGETFSRQFGCEVVYLLRTGGKLVDAYRRVGRVIVTEDDPAATESALTELRDQGFEQSITNTTVTGELVPTLKQFGFRVVSLVHEMPGITASYGLEGARQMIAESSDRVVFAANAVAAPFQAAAPQLDDERVVVRPQGSYRRIEPDHADPALRRRLGIPEDAIVVLNVGYADHRKGIDRYAEVARCAARLNDRVHFVWLGALAPEGEQVAAGLARDPDLSVRVHFASFTDEIDRYFLAADVFFLSSREDPFPTVILEALDAGLALAGYRDSSGTEPLIEEHGVLVDAADPPAAAAAILELGRSQTTRRDERLRNGRRTVEDRFRFDEYVADLLRLVDPSAQRVSVVVPNFNYAQYLEERLHSIFDQTYPVFEVLVLDDCSTDDSVATVERVVGESGRVVRLVRAEQNSGSAFRQWARACEMARGDVVWIAEADDLSHPRFLERLAPRFVDPELTFAFSDSVSIDAEGRQLDPSYKPYYRRSVGTLMEQDLELGAGEFLRTCLSERNLVLNVSAVLWRRQSLSEALRESIEELFEYRLAGDWHLYAVAAANGGRVAYDSEPLNVHRRHDRSVTGALDKVSHLEEIIRVQDRITERAGFDPAVRARVEAYRKEITAQFGLDEAAAPRSDHLGSR